MRLGGMRARFTSDAAEWPKFGTLGEAIQADGNTDPESIEYGAWVFFPDGESEGAYCGADDFELVCDLDMDNVNCNPAVRG